MVPCIGTHALALIIEYPIRVADVLQVNAPVRSKHIPAPLDQAEGESPTGGGGADIRCGSDGASAVCHHIMTRDAAASRGDRDIARLAPKGSRAGIMTGLPVVVLQRKVAGDISAGIDLNIPASNGADP